MVFSFGDGIFWDSGVKPQFERWLTKTDVLPKGYLGRAIGYSQKQWPKLMRYLEDGRLSIDNNRAERAIKPFVIGRKNWLFNNTEAGAHASALLYSLVESARINGLTPYDYLHALLTALRACLGFCVNAFSQK